MELVKAAWILYNSHRIQLESLVVAHSPSHSALQVLRQAALNSTTACLWMLAACPQVSGPSHLINNNNSTVINKFLAALWINRWLSAISINMAFNPNSYIMVNLLKQLLLCLRKDPLPPIVFATTLFLSAIPTSGTLPTKVESLAILQKTLVLLTLKWAGCAPETLNKNVNVFTTTPLDKRWQRTSSRMKTLSCALRSTS